MFDLYVTVSSNECQAMAFYICIYYIATQLDYEVSTKQVQSIITYGGVEEWESTYTVVLCDMAISP